MDKEPTDTTDINSRLTNIEETLGGMNQSLSRVVATVDKQSQQIEAVGLQLQTLITTVGQQEKRLGNLESDMQEVKIDIQYIKSDITDVKEDLRVTNTRIDTVVQTIDARIDALSQTLGARIDSVNQNIIATHNSVDERIDNLNARMDRIYRAMLWILGANIALWASVFLTILFK